MSHFQVQVLAVIGDKTCVTELYTKNGRLHGVGNLTPSTYYDEREDETIRNIMGIRSADLPEGLSFAQLFDALMEAVAEETGVAA